MGRVVKCPAGITSRSCMSLQNICGFSVGQFSKKKGEGAY